MADRLIPYLKGACGILLLIVLMQLAGVCRARDPLSEVQLPASTSTADRGGNQNDRGSAGTTNGFDTKRSGKGPDIPEPVREQMDRIIGSELFGPLPKPVPIALLGIAGDKAFLQVTNGAMGRLGEGETLGGVTVVRITTNRVLIEHGGETNELTLFSGMGSDSLLPDDKTTKK